MNEATGQLDFAGRRVTVMGLGRFGGGAGAVRFLCERGAIVTLTDLLDEQSLAASLAKVDDCRLHALRLGRHKEDDFSDADLVVASPAVPPDNRFLNIARAAGVPVTSEMNLFWQANRGTTIGVTGSNGKSTTAAMIHSMIEAAGLKCRLGGNIGRSLLPVVDQIGPDEWVILELSSFQLEDLNRLRGSPRIAVVTNFTPNHLDRHGSLDGYRRAKQTILRWQSAGDTAVLNAGDADVSRWPVRGRRLDFGTADGGGEGVFQSDGHAIFRVEGREKTLPLFGMPSLPGRHNLQNAMAAACAALAVGIEPTTILEGLQHFRSLPHRLEFIGEAAERKFYNDSKATTPESARAALESFTDPVVLLAGGYDKHVDLTSLADQIAERAKAVALMGQTAGRLFEQIAARKAKQTIPMRVCNSLEDAFAWAVAQSSPGDAVLLSPGCASYDWFRDFEERGERFSRLAREWCGRGGALNLENVNSRADLAAGG
jgi:UDP-N-acetylmuramoylalanine--D-glutamate ligase